NEAHGITPTSVQRAVQESLHTILKGREIESSVVNEAGGNFSLSETLRELEEEMLHASANPEYEKAALLRDLLGERKPGTGLSETLSQSNGRRGNFLPATLNPQPHEHHPPLRPETHRRLFPRRRIVLHSEPARR